MSIWIDPDDAPKLPPQWFAGAEIKKGDTVLRPGRPRSDAPKQPVSLRLDQDVVAWFKREGDGWQTRMNRALRDAAGL